MNDWLILAGIVLAATAVGLWYGVVGFIFALLLLILLWVAVAPGETIE